MFFFTRKSQVWCHFSWESFARNLEPYHFSGYKENFEHDPHRWGKNPNSYLEIETENSKACQSCSIEDWSEDHAILSREQCSSSKNRLYLVIVHCKYVHWKYHEIVVVLKYHKKLHFLKYFYTGYSAHWQGGVCNSARLKT